MCASTGLWTAGVLKGYDGGDVTIETAGEARTFVKKDVAQVRLTVHF